MSGPSLTRKTFLGLPAAAPLAVAQANQARPNVLILMSDQHRPEYMTAAGNATVPTPELDRIAARGVRFTNAICPYPVCAASRASLMTGLYPHTTAVINNSDRLSWQTRTIAHHFADAGYLTGLIGKMHFNDPHTRGFHYRLGFNDWFQYLGPKVRLFANDIANHSTAPQFFDTVNDDGSGLPELPALWDRWKGKGPWAGQVDRMPLDQGSQLDAEDSIDAFIARESVRFMDDASRTPNRPWLLVAGFLRPHPPLHAPREWAAQYPAAKMAIPDPGDLSRYPRHIQQRAERYRRLGEHRLKSAIGGYLANLAYLDTCLGQVYRALESRGLADNTIVVYTSDHGEMNGDHGLYGKFCMFRHSIGVPLIVSWPGRAPEGKTASALTEYFGLYPTLAELCGLPSPGRLDARSFAAAVRDPATHGPDAMFAEYNLRSRADCYMAATREWKYVWNHGDIAELYDLHSDPEERRNRAGEPGVARFEAEMKDRLFGWHNPERNPFRPAV
jgi:choline-sulfatase